jgi:hypothetical protein
MRKTQGMTSRTTHSLLAVVLALDVGCARRSPAPSQEVDRVWKRNEATITRALQGDFQEEPLMAAVSFFEETSGIKSPKGLDCKALITMPTPALVKDLERWRAWYAEHSGELYVDAGSGAIKRRAGTPR